MADMTKADNLKEKLAKKVFENLKKHIGQDITYISCKFDGIHKTTSTLREIKDFEYIVTDEELLPFIGRDSAIMSISSKYGETLYFNKYLQNYYIINPCSEKRFALESLKFGNRIATNHNEDKKRTERLKKFEELLELENKKRKYSLMKRGLTLVKEDKIEAWLEYVDKNTDDEIDASKVEALVSVMEKLEENIPLKKAESIVYDELNFAGYVAAISSFVTEAVQYFYKDYEKYQNNNPKTLKKIEDK